MDKPTLSNTYEIQDINGEPMRLTLSYRWLYKLRAEHREQYEAYNEVMTKGLKDVFDNITILYTAYLCNILKDTGDTSEAVSFDEFLDLLPVDQTDVVRAVGMLVAPKKTMASAALS